MDRFKALSLVLLGVAIGLGYAVACGSDADDATSAPIIPGVNLAMAQGACASWEVTRLNRFNMTQTGTMPLVNDPNNEGHIHAVPAGWTPLSGDSDDTLWMVRCAQ